MPERYKALQHSYAQLEADFHMLANSIPQLAWMTRPDGWIFWYNQRWFDFTGTTLEDMQGSGWKAVHHPDHVDRVAKHFNRAFETGEPWEDTFPLRSKDGDYRWFLSRAVPIRDTEGNIIRWFGTNTDITEQKRIEERQTLIMREIDHRAKNALAVAQSVVNLTRADSIKDYKAAVEGRIGSLARTHSLLAASQWHGAELRTLLHDETSSFSDDAANRITLSGEPVTLSPETAQTLALIVHELTTNAAKYGALSHPEGRIGVSWVERPDGISISWRETGGSGLTPPQSPGFGTQLLDRIIADHAGGTLERTWHSDGLAVEIRLTRDDGPAEADQAEPGKRTGPRTQHGKPSILVLEDEALTAIDLEFRLQDAGYEVMGPASTIAHARETISHGLPDIALLDSNLSGERSFTFAEELVMAGVPVVFCTGYEELEGITEVLSACPIISKPFRDAELMAAIETARHPAMAEQAE
ncbi:MAG: HWE histidine kinase domain-containing protein [Henriciella sp.]|uniref:HWE histidine kinase domain-containing protein n=1 Tax=Henriciella sp. TaxID=1968823 RepID=UPI0032EE324D